MAFEIVETPPILTLEETRAELQKVFSTLSIKEHWTIDPEQSLEERLAELLVAPGEINLDLADVITFAAHSLELDAYDRMDAHLSLPVLLKTSLELLKPKLYNSNLLVLLKDKDGQDLELEELDDCIAASYEYVDKEAKVIVGNFNLISTPEPRVLILAFKRQPT